MYCRGYNINDNIYILTDSYFAAGMLLAVADLWILQVGPSSTTAMTHTLLIILA